MSEDRQYSEPTPMSLAEATAVFQNGNPKDICQALINTALTVDSPDSVLLWCLFFLGHPDRDVASAAASAIGHIARIHHSLNSAVVVPALEIARSTKQIPTAEDALEDIVMFCC